MEDIPNPFIGLNVNVGNYSEFPAAKARLVVYTPDRNIVLHEVEQNISLNPGEETLIPVNFTLPGVSKDDYGICHVDYELYDSENNLI